MVWITIENSAIGRFGTIILRNAQHRFEIYANFTHVFLLLVHMTNLKPNILLRQRGRRRVHNIFKTL